MVDENRTVSLVMPTFNRPRLLRRAIEAVLASTYDDFTLTIFDNASEAETRDVVEKFQAIDARVDYYRHEHNVGAYANFAFGVDRVSTPFFALLSDDDVPLPNFLQVVMAGFEHDPDAGFSAGATLEFNDRGELIWAPQSIWKRFGRFEGQDGLSTLVDGKHPSWNTIVFRTEVVRELGSFDTTLGLVFDLEFTLRIAAHYPFVVAPDPVGIFVRHADSSTEFANARVGRDYREVINRIGSWQVSATMRTFLQQSLERAMIQRLNEIVVKKLIGGDSASASEALAMVPIAGRSSLTYRILALLLSKRSLATLARPTVVILTTLWQTQRRKRCVEGMRAQGLSTDLRSLAARLRSKEIF